MARWMSGVLEPPRLLHRDEGLVVGAWRNLFVSALGPTARARSISLVTAELGKLEPPRVASLAILEGPVPRLFTTDARRHSVEALQALSRRTAALAIVVERGGVYMEISRATLRILGGIVRLGFPWEVFDGLKPALTFLRPYIDDGNGDTELLVQAVHDLRAAGHEDRRQVASFDER